MAAPVGVTHSPGPGAGRVGAPALARISSVAGAGSGMRPCCESTHPSPSGHDRRVQALDAEGLEARRAPDDVDDGVDGADLVEVHALDRRAVHLGFGGGEALEHGRRVLP